MDPNHVNFSFFGNEAQRGGNGGGAAAAAAAAASQPAANNNNNNNSNADPNAAVGAFGSPPPAAAAAAGYATAMTVAKENRENGQQLQLVQRQQPFPSSPSPFHRKRDAGLGANNDDTAKQTPKSAKRRKQNNWSSPNPAGQAPPRALPSPGGTFAQQHQGQRPLALFGAGANARGTTTGIMTAVAPPTLAASTTETASASAWASAWASASASPSQPSATQDAESIDRRKMLYRGWSALEALTAMYNYLMENHPNLLSEDHLNLLSEENGQRMVDSIDRALTDHQGREVAFLRAEADKYKGGGIAYSQLGVRDENILYSIFARYDETKLKNVEDILSKSAGGAESLIQNLSAQHNFELAEFGVSHLQTAPGDVPTAAQLGTVRAPPQALGDATQTSALVAVGANNRLSPAAATNSCIQAFAAGPTQTAAPFSAGTSTALVAAQAPPPNDRMPTLAPAAPRTGAAGPALMATAQRSAVSGDSTGSSLGSPPDSVASSNGSDPMDSSPVDDPAQQQREAMPTAGPGLGGVRQATAFGSQQNTTPGFGTSGTQAALGLGGASTGTSSIFGAGTTSARGFGNVPHAAATTGLAGGTNFNAPPVPAVDTMVNETTATTTGSVQGVFSYANPSNENANTSTVPHLSPPEELFLYNKKEPIVAITEFYERLVQEGRMTEDEKNKKLVKRRNDLETYKGSEVAMLQNLAGQYDKDWSTLGVSDRHVLASIYRKFDNHKLPELDSIFNEAKGMALLADLILADLVLEHRFDPAEFGIKSVSKFEELALNLMDQADQKAGKSLSALREVSLDQQNAVVEDFVSKKYPFLYDAVQKHREEKGALHLIGEANKMVEKSFSILRGLSDNDRAQLFQQFLSEEYSALHRAVKYHHEGKAASGTGGSDGDTVATQQSMESMLYLGGDTTMFSMFEEKDSKELAMISKSLISVVGRAADCAMLGTKDADRPGPIIDDEEVFDAIMKLGGMNFGASAQFFHVLNENGLAPRTHSEWKKKISFFGAKSSVRSQNLRDFWKVMFFGGMEADVSRDFPKELMNCFLAERRRFEEKKWGREM